MATSTQIIEIDDTITVGAFAELLSLPVSKVIAELFKNGVMATVNEKIDFDTAQIIVGELGLEEVELAKKERQEAPAREKRVAGEAAEGRPPVVAVMGHVDHGKTSLLDAIRGEDVAAGEAGGITQHISAYQVEHNGRKVTLLDTPGHEAFAALREHGARLTDLVVIVVAADDGVKPQTLEAIRFARKAGVKIIVAANKMDKPEANLDKLKQQLAEAELLPEDWGGETIVMPVSAKTKSGIPELLDMILLVADVEDLKADVDVPAEGLIIESHMEQGRGPVAVALVERGTMKRGDFVVVGSTYGKIRNLESTTGQVLTTAGPSTPVLLTGFKTLPEFGDEFDVVKDERIARSKSSSTATVRQDGGSTASTSSELLRIISRTNKLNELNVLVKADVQGSVTSVIDSLKTLGGDEVAIRVVGSGVGVVNENDIHLAATSNAIIYGFHIALPGNIRQLAVRDRVSVRLYSVIYELIDDAKEELVKLLPDVIVEDPLGSLKIKAIFKTTKTEVICGGEVTKGRLALPALARVYRGKELLADELEVLGLKRGPQPVKEVLEGELCGINLRTETALHLEEGDRLDLFTRHVQERTL